MVYQKIDLLVMKRKMKIYSRMKEEILGKIERMEDMKFANALMCGQDLADVKREMERYTSRLQTEKTKTAVEKQSDFYYIFNQMSDFEKFHGPLG